MMDDQDELDLVERAKSLAEWGDVVPSYVVAELVELVEKMDVRLSRLRHNRNELSHLLEDVPVRAIHELIFGENDDVFSDEYIAYTNKVSAWLVKAMNR